MSDLCSALVVQTHSVNNYGLDWYGFMIERLYIYYLFWLFSVLIKSVSNIVTLCVAGFLSLMGFFLALVCGL